MTHKVFTKFLNDGVLQECVSICSGSLRHVVWSLSACKDRQRCCPQISFGSMRCTLVLSAVWSACIQQAVCSRSIDYEPPLPEIPLDSQDEFVDDEIRNGDGAWLAGYAKLHEAIVRRQVPAARQRFAVWTCAALHKTVEIGDDSTRLCAGLANRIMGLVGTRLRTF